MTEDVMRMLVTAAAVAALGLAACNESTPATEGAAASGDSSTAAPAAAAPAPAAAPAAAAIEGPAAGKWSMTVSMMGRTMPPNEVCYTKVTSLAEAEKMQQQAGMTCSEQNYHREGDAFVGHSVCTSEIAGKTTTSTTDTRVTGDFNTKYVMDLVTRLDPAPAPGMGEQKMSITAERIGDC
jgi:hypothetical protein